MLGEPVPPGYRRMQDAQVKPAWQRWAKQINDQTYPGHYGEIFHNIIDGVPIAAIVEHHSYTVRNGQNIPGNYHGVSLLWPPDQPVSQPVSAPVGAKARDWLDLAVTCAVLATSGIAIYSFVAKYRAEKRLARHLKYGHGQGGNHE